VFSFKELRLDSKRVGRLCCERKKRMDIQSLENFTQNIQVRNLINEDVEVINHSPLKLIGKGRQGAVFQFTDEICVKVFGNEEDCEREYYALSLGQPTELFPKLYAKGSLFIAMEIIRGVDLREYLQSQPLTQEISLRLIEMLVIFKNIGFDRIDHHKRQIFLQPDGKLKVIDVARAVWRDRVYPYPRKLLTSLGEDNKAVFLSHVQALAPELYQEWEHYIRMDELGRQIFQVLMENPSKKDKVRPLSKRLLTTKEEATYVLQLENLVRKVFKEEWVKTMLAKGYDPDVVLAKMDEYWERQSQNATNVTQNSMIDIDILGELDVFGERVNQGEKNSKDDIDNKENKDKKREKGKHGGKERHEEKDKHGGKERHGEKGKHGGKDSHREKGKHNEKDSQGNKDKHHSKDKNRRSGK
jgi:predicted Ser/Thr protein kinase